MLAAQRRAIVAARHRIVLGAAWLIRGPTRGSCRVGLLFGAGRDPACNPAGDTSQSSHCFIGGQDSLRHHYDYTAPTANP